MKKIIFLFSFFLVISCTDPFCREYEATVSLKNIDKSNYSCYVSLQDEDKSIVVRAYLNDNNKFTETYKPWGMGPQVDLRYPDKTYELNGKFALIKSGGTYTIYEGDSQNRVAKYTITCTSDDVKEIIDDRLYRCYEITLDWNKRVPINE